MKRSSSKSPNLPSSSGRWAIHPLPSILREQYALPKELPVPRKEVRRFEGAGVNISELATWIGKYLDEFPDSPDGWTYRAVRTRLLQHEEVVALQNAGKAEEAIALLRKMIAEPPGDARSKYSLGTALFHMGEAEEALQHLNDAATAFGQNVSYSLLRARVLGRLGQVEEMRRLLHKLMQQNPGNASVQKELVANGELIPVHLNPRDLTKCRFAHRKAYAEAIGKEVEKAFSLRKASEILKLAKAQFDERRFDIAALIARRVLDLEPDSPEANHYVGIGDLMRDQPVNAESRLRIAHKAHPSDSKIVVALARALHQQDRAKEAFELLREFLEQDPNCVEVAELLVLWHAGADERRTKVEELAAKYPYAWLPVKLRGDLAFSAGQVEEALGHHRQSWAMQPSDDAATMILHELDSLGRGEEAVAFAMGLEDLNSRTAPLRWNAANVCIKSGRLKPAVTILDKMVSDTKLPTDTRFNATLLLSEVLASSRVR